MARLALFRGGFTLHAAEEVTHTSPYVLTALVEKSLIRLDEFERYQVHELLRRFAYEKLAGTQQWAAAAATHAQFFLVLTTGLRDALCNNHQQAALAAIQAELDNVRTAWLWALQQPELPGIAPAIDSMYRFYLFTCRYSEGKELFAGSAARLRDQAPYEQSQPTSAIAGRLATRAAVCAFHLGEHEQSAQHFQSLLTNANHNEVQDDVAIAHTFLGLAEGWQGHFAEAEHHLQTSVALYQELGDRSSMAAVLHGMSDMYAHSGWFEKAVDCAQRCLLIGMQLGRADLIGNAHCELGYAQKSLGYPKLALEHYRQGCIYSEKSGDRLAYAMNVGGVGIELCQLGKKQWAQGFALIEQSLAICQELGHSVHIVTRLFSLAQACHEGKQYAEALPYTEQLLQVATAVNFRRALTFGHWVMAESYFELGDFVLSRQHLHLALKSSESIEWDYPALTHVVASYALLLEKQAEQVDSSSATQYYICAVTLAAAARRWPAWRAYHRKAEQLLARQRARLTAAEFAAAQAAAEHGTLQALVAHAESSLAF
jgi:tetratricopeptide (TPR) repeat protein